MAHIALIQFDIAWEQPQENIARVTALLEAYTGPDFDVLILPETWAMGFSMSHHAHQAEATALQFMEQLAQRYQCSVIGGVAAKADDQQENRCYWVRDNQRQYYVKNRTFNFTQENQYFRAGHAPQTWQIADVNLSPLICYDLRFPELARRIAKASDVLLYIANWPSVREHHWRSLAVARAIENQAYVVTVNRIGADGSGLMHPGASLVIDPLGQILLDAAGKAGVFTCHLDPAKVQEVRQKWPFLADM